MWNLKWKKVKEYIPETLFSRKCLARIKENGAKTLLDIGCGDGKDSFFFAKQGISVTALDFSEEAIKHLKRKMLKQEVRGVTPVLGDILSFKINKKFDVIYAHLSLHYFSDEDTNKVFSKLFSLLNKGGLLFIKCKSTKDCKFGEGKKVEENYYLRKGHLRHFFSEEYLRRKLENFELIKISESSSEHVVIEGPNHIASFIEVVARKTN